MTDKNDVTDTAVQRLQKVRTFLTGCSNPNVFKKKEESDTASDKVEEEKSFAVSDPDSEKASVSRNGFWAGLSRIIPGRKDTVAQSQTDPDTSSPEDTDEHVISQSETVKEFLKTMILALVLALSIRSFIAQPFNIPSESMVPTLLVGDYLFVNKASYGYGRYSLPLGLPLFEGRIWSAPVKRGEVIVFRVPRDGNRDYIKRVVGIGGDRIRITNSVLFINGIPVKREFQGKYDGKLQDVRFRDARLYKETLPNGVSYMTIDTHYEPMMDNTVEYHVPDGHYFVMGDNRDNSADSRVLLGAVGYVPKENLIGRASLVFFSLEDAAFYEVWKWLWSIRYNRIFSGIV